MSAGQEILAQDEIDALIHGIGNGDVPTEAPPARDEARQYNFSQNTRIVRGRMPTLVHLITPGHTLTYSQEDTKFWIQDFATGHPCPPTSRRLSLRDRRIRSI